MDIKEQEEAGHIAQEISFAFEDLYHDTGKQKMFLALFDRYLLPVDPGGSMVPYDAIMTLWRRSPAEFKQMVLEMKNKKLISLE